MYVYRYMYAIVCVYMLIEVCEFGYVHATAAMQRSQDSIGYWSLPSTYFETEYSSGSPLFTLAGKGASGDFPLVSRVLTGVLRLEMLVPCMYHI